MTKASTYAEYNIALSEAVSKLNYIRKLLKVFGINLTEPIKVYEDKSGAINITKFGNFTKNSKHIEIHTTIFVHENIREKLINVIKINTDDNITDMFTNSVR